jgi:hypothetical protein
VPQPELGNERKSPPFFKGGLRGIIIRPNPPDPPLEKRGEGNRSV